MALLLFPGGYPFAFQALINSTKTNDLLLLPTKERVVLRSCHDVLPVIAEFDPPDLVVGVTQSLFGTEVEDQGPAHVFFPPSFPLDSISGLLLCNFLRFAADSFDLFLRRLIRPVIPKIVQSALHSMI